VATTIPYDWLRTLSPELKGLDEAPLLGFAPTFPWKTLSGKLGQLLESSSLTIEGSDLAWRDSNQFKEGFGECLELHFAVAPLPGILTLLIPREELSQLTASLLTHHIEDAPLIDPDFTAAFERFLILEIATLFPTIGFDASLSLQLSEGALPNQAALTLDIKVEQEGHPFWTRLIIPQAFRQVWKERFAQRSLDVSPAWMQRVTTTLHLEIGNTILSRQEWAQLQPGDWLMLDICSYDPSADKGRLMVTVSGKPLFLARFKEGNVKIMDYPLAHEVNTPMDPSDDDFTEEHSAAEQDEEDTPETVEAPENPFPEPEEEAPPENPSKPIFKIEELPLTVTIELGSIQLSLEKLATLQPGNLLELNIRPEEGVDLVINGACVGKGELLKIGDVLGVRILELA